MMDNIESKSIDDLVLKQRSFYGLHGTRSVAFRKEQLKKLEHILRTNESLLFDAIYADLKKSKQDTITTELALIYHELRLAVRKLSKWSNRKRVGTNFINFPSQSYILPEPFGVVYIAGAWNYPYQLTLLPLVSAMAAGNTALVKPSEMAAHTSQVVARLITANFPADCIHVVEGG